MPPLIVAVAAALGGTALVRRALREARRLQDEIERLRQPHYGEPQLVPIRRLRRDPVTGAYRPE
jgi:plasmid stabilization system protein ParE